MDMPKLTDDQKSQMEAQMKEFRTSMEYLQKKMKEATSEDDKKAIMAKIKELLDSNKAKMEEIAPGMKEAHQKMEKMMKEKMGKPEGHEGMMGDESSDRNKMMKEKMMEKMKEKMGDGMGEKKGGAKGKYKEAFAKRLSTKIQDMSAEKLQTILDKLTATEEKIKANTAMSEAKKSNLLAQVMAIKELVQEALDMKQADAELNIDGIFQ